MNKIQVRDEFVQYVCPLLDKPIIQEEVEKSWKEYIKIMYEEGEITWAQLRVLEKVGLGLKVETIEKRLEYTPLEWKQLKSMREYARKYQQRRFGNA